MKLLVSLVFATALTACTHAAKSESRADRPATTRTAQASTMDSATIERLCLRPDSVRAGRAPCVLRDQSRSPWLRQPDPPPPRPK
jgi:hypothetical protein